MPLNRRSLLAAVRDRMRRQEAARQADDASPVAPAVAPPRVAARSRTAAPDHELEQIAAEARYRRERFELYRARVISGSSAATSSARLRELERTAIAADARLAHARRVRSSADDARR
jgi:hypothetical protein